VFLRLLLLFISVPLIELTLLLLLADLTEWYVALLLVVISGIVGSYLAHRQGWATWQKIWSQAGTGAVPGGALVDAAMILLAGGMLLTPGLLTDLFGISLLVPFCRKYYKAWLVSYLKVRMGAAAGAKAKAEGKPGNNGKVEVVDSYVVERKPNQEPDSR